MKTIKEWFESIKDEDVKKRALANMKYGDLEFDVLERAILYGLLWEETEEGEEYWDKQFCKALNNEL